MGHPWVFVHWATSAKTLQIGSEKEESKTKECLKKPQKSLLFKAVNQAGQIFSPEAKFVSWLHQFLQQT